MVNYSLPFIPKMLLFMIALITIVAIKEIDLLSKIHHDEAIIIIIPGSTG